MTNIQEWKRGTGAKGRNSGENEQTGVKGKKGKGKKDSLGGAG
jgi:hypothetical protein